MARVTFSEINQVPDAMPGESFRLALGKIPGAGDTPNLEIKCSQCIIPGYGNEAFEVNLHGHSVRFRGRLLFPKQMAATYIEDSTYETTNTLRTWHNEIVNVNTGASGIKREYALSSAVLSVYNQQDVEVDRLRFTNLFINDVPDVQLDGSSTSQPIMVAVTFSYDKYERIS